MSLRKRYLYWGATAAEIERVMPGDAAIPEATYDTTLGITIDAPAADIWPWLVQMGYRRGGWTATARSIVCLAFSMPRARNECCRSISDSRWETSFRSAGVAGFPLKPSSPSARWCSAASRRRFQLDVAVRAVSSRQATDTARLPQPGSRPEDARFDPLHVRPRTGRVHHDAQDAARPQAPGGASRNGET